MKHFLSIRALAVALVSALLLAACGYMDEVKLQTTNRIAMPAFMVKRVIPAGQFKLLAWERMHERGQPATVYIEGDGKAWFSAKNPPGNPTPMNPVGLHLASRDNSDNLVWLSRPCQYADETGDECETNEYWTTKAFSPEVIAGYNAALDEIRARYDITGFNLVGYSGGANIAGVLAAQRKDVLSLRTVAGNLNPVLVDNAQGVSAAPGSLSAKEMAPQVANIPQHHFIGAGDNVINPDHYHSFRQAMGPSQCVYYSVVQDADHERGWVEKWPRLLEQTVTCVKPAEPAPFPDAPYDGSFGKGPTK